MHCPVKNIPPAAQDSWKGWGAGALRVGRCGGTQGGDRALSLPPPTTKSSLTRLHNSASARGPQPRSSSCEKQVSKAFSTNRNKQKCAPSFPHRPCPAPWVRLLTLLEKGASIWVYRPNIPYYDLSVWSKHCCLGDEVMGLLFLWAAVRTAHVFSVSRNVR